MTSLALAISVPLVFIILFSQKRVALLAVAAGILYLPQQQALDVLGITVTSTRVFELAGFIRVAMRQELRHIKVNKIDRTFLLLYTYTTLVFLFRSDGHQMEMIGLMVDAIFSYYLFRTLLEGESDVRWFLSRFLILLIPFVGILAVESHTGRNPFALLGAGFFEFRDGRLRALASFRNSSSLGTLGASFLPLYIGLALVRNSRLAGWVGAGMACSVVYFSNSGGPASAALFGIIAWLAWPLRKSMTRVRLLLVMIVASLAFIMQAPIWYLPARISAITGGGGWHRSRLLEIAAQRVGDWWLVGMDLSRTREWFAYVLHVTDSADITNNFLMFGLRAGAGSILLLLLLLVTAFSALGIMMRADKAPADRKLLWGLGCMLVVHIVSWFGISYFDQITVFWFMHLAMVSTMFQHHLSLQEERVELRHPPQLNHIHVLHRAS